MRTSREDLTHRARISQRQDSIWRCYELRHINQTLSEKGPGARRASAGRAMPAHSHATVRTSFNSVAFMHILCSIAAEARRIPVSVSRHFSTSPLFGCPLTCVSGAPSEASPGSIGSTICLCPDRCLDPCHSPSLSRSTWSGLPHFIIFFFVELQQWLSPKSPRRARRIPS